MVLKGLKVPFYKLPLCDGDFNPPTDMRMQINSPTVMRMHSVPVNLNFVVISPYFAIFKNVVHSSEIGETPSYSASHQAPNYAQHSLI